MDYRKYLGAHETMVLPYLGGPFVHAIDRRLRVTTRVAAGWWRFDVHGRMASPRDRAEAPTLRGSKSARGHCVGPWMFVTSERVERLHLGPDEEIPILTPVRAIRWPTGDCIYESTEFDDEAEEAARKACIEGQLELGPCKGAVPSLRAAFRYAVLRREAAARGLQLSPLQSITRSTELVAHEAARRAWLDELEARTFVPGWRPTRPPPAERGFSRADAEERAADGLAAARASLLGTRWLAERSLEVVFRCEGETFVSIVDGETLHVYDAGICLSGADEELGLQSLPSVIREAIRTGRLVITRSI